MHGKDSDSRESGARQMIRAIVGMAHGLDLKVVAEGVENALQHKVIENEACDLSQGFFHHKPMSAQMMGEVLASEYREKSERSGSWILDLERLGTGIEQAMPPLVANIGHDFI